MSTTRIRLEDLEPTSLEEAERINAIPDEEIDCSEIPELDEEWFRNAKLVRGPHSLRVDDEVFDWFRGQGRDPRTIMNVVLRAYMMGAKGQPHKEEEEALATAGNAWNAR